MTLTKGEQFIRGLELKQQAAKLDALADQLLLPEELNPMALIAMKNAPAALKEWWERLKDDVGD